MAGRRKIVAAGAKRNELASSSVTILDEEEDNRPLFSAKLPVAKKARDEAARDKVKLAIIGSWKVVVLGGKSVRKKLTSEEKRRYGRERDTVLSWESSDSQENTDPEPDYLVSDEEGPYIDHTDPDDPMENVCLFVLGSFSVKAELARRAVVGALGSSRIRFRKFSKSE